jgi:hypothetical protein
MTFLNNVRKVGRLVLSRTSCLNVASKSFAAAREAFRHAYPDKEVPNKTVS